MLKWNTNYPEPSLGCNELPLYVRDGEERNWSGKRKTRESVEAAAKRISDRKCVIVFLIPRPLHSDRVQLVFEITCNANVPPHSKQTAHRDRMKLDFVLVMFPTRRRHSPFRYVFILFFTFIDLNLSISERRCARLRCRLLTHRCTALLPRS